MQVKFFCPTWGMDLSDAGAVVSRIKHAGYDGVEIGFPLHENKKQKEILQAAQNENLLAIAQHYDVEKEDFAEYLKLYTEHLYFLSSLRPYLINSLTGKDYFSFEENCEILKRSFEIENETGIRIIHETHRGKFSYSINVMQKYLEQFPLFRLTADFSHYCVSSESYLQSTQQRKWINDMIKRTDHLHARVGHIEGPQINDPRAEEWKEAFNYHLQWWDSIVEQNQQKDIFTITTEFGPPPYMPQLPFSCEPVSSQWDINLFMKELLYKRYNS